MSLPLERWAKQAARLERKVRFGPGGIEEVGHLLPVADSRVLHDLKNLVDMHRLQWKYRQRDLQRARGAAGDG
jgi:hypothetical protein